MANKDLQKEINTLIDLQKKYFSIRYDNDVRYSTEKEILSLEMQLQNNNCINVFLENYYTEIIDTLRKYENKRIGEKTREKIASEIKELSSDIDFVYFHSGYNSWDSNNYTLSIELKNETYTHSKVRIKIYFWCYGNSDYNVDIKYAVDINGCKKENYVYVDNTREKAEQILSSYKELKAFKEEKLKEINDRIDKHFEDHNLRIIENYDYYTIKKIY